jgi:amino acid transporter
MVLSTQKRIDVGATASQRLGRFTVVCLILNRTIGTGIFAQPSNVLYLTGSPAVALILWILGGLIVLCIAFSWLELGLAIPLHYVRSAGAYFWAPRSGGDKNYLEYIYKRPRLLMSCVFGITFLLFGNLAGNAIQFGIYMQHAISPECTEDDVCFKKAGVIMWALMITWLCCLLNVATRKLFVGLNNAFAVLKLLLVVATALLGIIYGATHDDGCRTNMAWSNRGAGGELGDIVLAISYAVYPYSGFEQPFYVLADVDRPRDTFAGSVIAAIASVMLLFPLTNVGFFCVVPYRGPETVPRNMALEFYDTIARNGDPGADVTATNRAMSVVLAMVICGSLMAQTFTGARVKQEIAKEAIIPFSLAIATGSDSFAARLRAPEGSRYRQRITPGYINDHPEQVPMFATLLHGITGTLLILAVGIPAKPSSAYRILTYLRVFSIVIVLGLLTVAGLAYLRIDSWWHGVRPDPQNQNLHLQQPAHTRGRRWLEIRDWVPPLDWVPSFVATAALAFLSVAVFVKPSQIREDEKSTPYWVKPLAGWLVLLLGVLWWAGLRFWQWKTRTRTEVYRRPHLHIDRAGGAVLKAELIEHRRGVRF